MPAFFAEAIKDSGGRKSSGIQSYGSEASQHSWPERNGWPTEEGEEQEEEANLNEAQADMTKQCNAGRKRTLVDRARQALHRSNIGRLVVVTLDASVEDKINKLIAEYV